VARALGVTQPRITQIAGLLRLSPELQEGVLLGGIDLGGRGAMRAASSVEWGKQGERWLATDVKACAGERVRSRGAPAATGTGNWGERGGMRREAAHRWRSPLLLYRPGADPIDCWP